MVFCDVCRSEMIEKKAKFFCPKCHYIKPCCQPDEECLLKY